MTDFSSIRRGRNCQKIFIITIYKKVGKSIRYSQKTENFRECDVQKCQKDSIKLQNVKGLIDQNVRK